MTRKPTPLPLPRPTPDAPPVFPQQQGLSHAQAIRQLDALSYATARCAVLEDERNRAVEVTQMLQQENVELRRRLAELESSASTPPKEEAAEA